MPEWLRNVRFSWNSAIEAGKLVAIVVVRGDPVVWFMRLHTCATGAACQRQCVLGAIAKALKL